jgi:hypothetical protein
MNNKFSYVLLSMAVLLAGTAGYFSIFGLSSLFAGASLAVIIMASVLEIGKVIITTALHTYWSNLNKVLKIYLTIAVGVLMIITSAGIYGFLSNAYQKTANELEIHEGEINVLVTKKEAFQASIDENKKLISDKVKEKDETSNRLNKRIDNIDFTKGNQSRRADIATAEGNKRLNTISSEIDVLNTKNSTLLDSVNKYNVKVLELKSGSKIAGEVGPLKYISELSGIPMANVVNYLILLLIFVFDPLAIALVLTTNRIFELNGQQTPLEPKIYDEEEGTDNELKQTANKYNEEAKRVWEGVKKMREEGKLHTPTQEDIENEPNALAFTQHEIEEDYTDVINEEVKVDEETGVIELPEELLEVPKDVWVPISEEIVEVQPLAEPDGTGLLSYMDVIEPVKEERIIRKEDIKEIKERGFSVAIPKRDKNTIQRIGSNKEIRNGEEDKIFFNKNK